MSSFNNANPHSPLPLASWLDLLHQHQRTLPIADLPSTYIRAEMFREYLLMRYSPLDRFTPKEFADILDDYLAYREEHPHGIIKEHAADGSFAPMPGSAFDPPECDAHSRFGRGFDLAIHFYIRVVAVALLAAMIYSCGVGG